MILLFALMAFYRVTPTISVVFLPYLILIMVLTAAGIGMWLAALAVQYRDINYAMAFGVQLLMYTAPVIYPTSLIPERYQAFYAINPMVGVIEGFRAALLGARPFPITFVVIGTLSALFLAATGALYFRRKERLFADVA